MRGGAVSMCAFQRRWRRRRSQRRGISRKLASHLKILARSLEIPKSILSTTSWECIAERKLLPVRTYFCVSHPALCACGSKVAIILMELHSRSCVGPGFWDLGWGCKPGEWVLSAPAFERMPFSRHMHAAWDWKPEKMRTYGHCCSYASAAHSSLWKEWWRYYAPCSQHKKGRFCGNILIWLEAGRKELAHTKLLVLLHITLSLR